MFTGVHHHFNPHLEGGLALVVAELQAYKKVWEASQKGIELQEFLSNVNTFAKHFASAVREAGRNSV